MVEAIQLFTPGVHLVDKPSGPSSHTIVNYFRRQSGISRIGHTGTLDPLASGLLIILVGREFTRLQEQFLKQDKEYQVTAVLGESTDTYDSTGTTTSSSDWSQIKPITEIDVKNALQRFHGSIAQQAPIYSAIKQHGQKLYDKARLGQIVVPPTRTVTIHQLELIAFEKDVKNQTLQVTLRVNCSSGTYIRSLVHDLGQTLRVGAHVSALRRTKIGAFTIKEASEIPGFIWSREAPDRSISQSD
jgi:tRNA pseudouridine55 synthase